MLCSVCGGNETRIVRRHLGPGATASIVQCIPCGFGWLDPMPSAEALHTLYGADYFRSATPLQGGYEDYAADEPLIRRTFARRLREVGVTPEPGGRSRALDIGCATGAFLEVLREAGWQAEGLELSPYAAEQARKKGFSVAQGDWRAASFPDGCFDLISLWDVIEHVPDARPLLEACRRWLAPGGCLLISTPDASAALARWLGSYWLGYRSAGEHVLFFGRPSLNRLLNQAGFERVAIRAVGKYMASDRVVTRLSYYTRIFRFLLPFKGFFLSRAVFYFSSGDTMMAAAHRVR